MSPAAKKKTQKKVDWISSAKKAQAVAEKRSSPRPLKDDELALSPGDTFLHEEIHGGTGVPMILMSAKISVHTRKENFSIPKTLAAEIQEATFGVKAGVALVALADYTVNRWESMAPGIYEILPHSEVVPAEVEGEEDIVNWTCRFKKTKSAKLQVRLDGPLAYGTNRGNKDHRRTIAVPADVRARIEKLIPKDIMQSGYPRFTGVVLGMAKWALDDIRRRGIQLHIRAAEKDPSAGQVPKKASNKK